MPTSPTAVSTLPTPPSLSDLATFSPRTDALLNALPGFVSGSNNLGTNMYNNAVEAYNNATTATAQASTATAAATSATNASNVTKWVSGTTYTEGACVWSPINFLTYRRRTTGSGTTDPSLDGTNYVCIIPVSLPVTIVTTTTQNGLTGNHYLMTNAAASGINLPYPAVANNEVWVTFTNGRYDNYVYRNSSTIYGDALDFLVNAGVLLTWQFKYINGDWKTL